jgi:FkbM family methyltransferase
MKNKIFLDLGTHFGQGLNQFIHMLNIDDFWQIYSFEANPVTFNLFNGFKKYENTKLNIKFLNQVISAKNGKTIINVETPPNEGETGMGSSIMELTEWNPWGGALGENFKTKYEIDCIDFSEFVNNFNDAEIFCKMDIEGAEFEVLEKMILNKSIFKINKIWIEFHDHFFVDKVSLYNRKLKIIDYFINHNINYELWY